LEKSVLLTDEQEVRSGDDNAALRIGSPKVTREKELIDRICSQQNGELDVMFLQLTYDAEHDGFLRKRGLRACKGWNGVTFVAFVIQIERNCRFSGNFCERFLPGGLLLLVGGTKEGNLARKRQMDDFRDFAVKFFFRLAIGAVRMEQVRQLEL